MRRRPGSSALACALVRAWTRAYTCGMDADQRRTRREEIESDLWESQHDQSPGATRLSSLQIATRLIAGAPADLLWRFDNFRQGREPMTKTIAAGTAATAVLTLLALYLMVRAPRVEFPTLPPPPLFTVESDVDGAPPPPPPDPTWEQFVRRVTTYGAPDERHRNR